MNKVKTTETLSACNQEFNRQGHVQVKPRDFLELDGTLKIHVKMYDRIPIKEKIK
jgi:hypothetical protein